MKKTDASGHDNNEYTEGNPALNIPATVVGSEEMNNIQNEIVAVVEAAGITLDGSDQDQMLQAINIGISEGGLGATTLNVSQSLLDNQAATTINGLEFSAASELAVDIRYHVLRRDDSDNYVESGKIHLSYNSETTSWDISVDTNDHSGNTKAPGQITFTVNASGQVQYATTSFGGANYSGLIKASFNKVIV